MKSRLRFAVLSVVVGLSLLSVAAAAATAVRELPTSTPRNPTFVPLAPRLTYQAGLVTPTPRFSTPVRGWIGAQFVSHQHNKVRFETAWASWQNGRPCGVTACSGSEVDIVAGPAMTESPVATITRVRDKDWNFDPYDPPGPVQTWTVAGKTALYFDATVPPGSPEWTLVGVNPPELKVARDHAFRMTALRVRGRTVVIVIQAPVEQFREFLPIAVRLVESLRFPPS